MAVMRALGIFLLSLACFIAAQNTGIALFLHLFYLLLGLLALSYGWAWLNLRGLRVERETLTSRTYVGEQARERLTLMNTWPLPKLWVEVQDHSSLPGHHAGFVTYLAGRQSTRWQVRTYCTRRGKFTLGPATLVSGDLFGIFRLTRALPATSELLVYPQLIDLPGFTLPEAELPGGQEVRARSFNATPNVATVRDYQPGDSYNRIHWRSSARTGRLIVKDFELDPTADVYIVLDMQERAVVRDTRRPKTPPQRAPAAPPQRASTEEYAVTAAASLARHLLNQRRAVGLVAWGQHREVVPAEREARQLVKILETLAIIRAQGEHGLAEVLLAEYARFGRSSTLVVITAAVDERWTGALQQVIMRGARVVVLYVDPQSFGGWRDPSGVYERLVELRVPAYRLRQGQNLADALRAPFN